MALQTVPVSLSRMLFARIHNIVCRSGFGMFRPGPVAGFAGLSLPTPFTVFLDGGVGILLKCLENVLVTSLAGFRADISGRLGWSLSFCSLSLFLRRLLPRLSLAPETRQRQQTPGQGDPRGGKARRQAGLSSSQGKSTMRVYESHGLSGAATGAITGKRVLCSPKTRNCVRDTRHSFRRAW